MASPARSGLVLWTIACYHGWNFHLIAFKWGWAWTTHEQVPSFEYRPSVMVIKINANGWVPSPPPKNRKDAPFLFNIYWVVFFPFFLYVIRANNALDTNHFLHLQNACLPLLSFLLFFYNSFFFLVCGLAFLTTQKARKSWGENSTGRKRRGNNQSPAILSCCWLALYLIHHLTHNLLLLLFRLNHSTIYS